MCKFLTSFTDVLLYIKYSIVKLNMRKLIIVWYFISFLELNIAKQIDSM